MLTAADIRAGQSFERPGPELTQASFTSFGQLHGTDAPIHVDPEYAARTPFGGTIAHGMMLLAFFEIWIRELFGDAAWDQGAHFNGKLIDTVKAGEHTTYRMEARQIENGRLTLALALHSGERLLALGEAEVPLEWMAE